MIEFNYVISAEAVMCDRCGRGEPRATAASQGWVVVPIRRNSNIHLCSLCIEPFDKEWTKVRETALNEQEN
jgi:hypothetical protein